MLTAGHIHTLPPKRRVFKHPSNTMQQSYVHHTCKYSCVPLGQSRTWVLLIVQPVTTGHIYPPPSHPIHTGGRTTVSHTHTHPLGKGNRENKHSLRSTAKPHPATLGPQGLQPARGGNFLGGPKCCTRRKPPLPTVLRDHIPAGPALEA